MRRIRRYQIMSSLPMNKITQTVITLAAAAYFHHFHLVPLELAPAGPDEISGPFPLLSEYARLLSCAK
jgi:hypothetical protein